MSGVVVVGAQWGDEGKGKIVDWLSSRADVVVRFQGGHNAGHTLVIDGKVFKLALLPSGLVRGGKLSVIGNGVVVDPWHMLTEIDGIRAQGVDVTPDNLVLADNASLILPWHKDIDAAREGDHSCGDDDDFLMHGYLGFGFQYYIARTSSHNPSPTDDRCLVVDARLVFRRLRCGRPRLLYDRIYD